MLPIPNAKEFDALMLRAHFLDIEVIIHHPERKVDLSKRFSDGVVSVNTDAEVMRALDLTLFDPHKTIHLDPGSPHPSSVFIDREIEVVYHITDPETMDRYSCPVFMGPVDDVSRDDVYVKIKGLSREARHVSNAWRAKEYKKKQKRTDVIRRIVRDRMGYTKYRIPNLKPRLSTDMKINRGKSDWWLIERLADSMGRIALFDAAGIFTLRLRKRTSVFTFNKDWVTQKPTKDYDLARVKNTVLVLGKKPKKKGRGQDGEAKDRKRPRYLAVAPRKHPLSPKNLGKNGKKRYLWIIVEDDSYRTRKECKAAAKRMLSRYLLAHVDVQWSGIPQPRLQEGDCVTINVPGTNTLIPPRSWTIPLRAGVDATYGYLKRSPAVSKKQQSSKISLGGRR